MRFTIQEIKKSEEIQNIKVGCWVESKKDNYLILRDGSCFQTLNAILQEKNFKDKQEYTLLNEITRGCSVLLKGNIIKSPIKAQQYEFHITSGKILGKIDKDISNNEQHVRMRTKTFQGIGLIRNTLQYEVHNFFNKLGFLNVSTPILTTVDCECSGETFNVIKKSHNFFHKNVYLTVSGQLHLEAFVHGFHSVYSFGPTFRAENGKSNRHLSEFWMIESEMSFIDFSDLMGNMEMFLKYLCSKLLKKHRDILEYFEANYEKGLIKKLEWISKIENKFLRKSYDDCLKFLWSEINCGNIVIGKENRRLENGVLVLSKKPEYGEYFGDEYGLILEKYLIEEFGNKPFFMTHFPKKIKPFYMKNDDSNLSLVEGCDLLVPGIGELMGGSMREEDYLKLKYKMEENGIKDDELEWYAELRKNGTIPHGGYGVGFERLICFVTGIKNIKDVIPFYRVEGSCFG